MVAEIEPVAGQLVPQNRVSKIPLSAKLKARALYVVQGVQPLEVAAQCGLSRKQVSRLAKAEGWTAARTALAGRALARAEAQAAEIVEATAQLSEAGAVRGLERAVAAADSNSEFAAKDFQAFSQGAKNLVQLYRQARGMDISAGGSSAAIGLFVVSVGSVAREEKTVSAEPIPAAAAPTEAFEF